MAIFMKYGANDGEVTYKTHEKWVELSSLQWGMGRGISAPGGGGLSKREASAPNISEIVVTKSMDTTSLWLLKEAIGGKASKVEIHLTQTDNNGTHIAYLKYILEQVLMSSYSISSGGDRPSESLSLNFTKFDSEYIAIDAEFKTKTTGHYIYDIATAVKS